LHGEDGTVHSEVMGQPEPPDTTSPSPTALPPRRTSWSTLPPSTNNDGGRGQQNASGHPHETNFNMNVFLKYWRDALKPNSYLAIPNSNAVLYKDASGSVRLLPTQSKATSKTVATAVPIDPNPPLSTSNRGIYRSRTPSYYRKTPEQQIYRPRTPEQQIDHPRATPDQNHYRDSSPSVHIIPSVPWTSMRFLSCYTLTI
jgi:hypothetical protein